MSEREVEDWRTDASLESVHVLILNQHGNNRGDEAAFRAVFAGIEEHSSDPVTFTVLHQFRGGVVEVDVPQNVRWIALVPSMGGALRLALFALGLFLGVRWRWILDGWGRGVVDAYARADVAISAPGGPYFGDLYAGHEPIHWFYVWMADRFDLPLMLYAPSVGPFEKRLRNPMRRSLFRTFRRVTLRESLSLEHFERLMGQEGPMAELVTDAAVQRPLPPYERAEYFGSGRTDLESRFLVGVSALKWGYPGHPDPGAAHARYEEVMLASLRHLHERRRAHFLLVPQLYGRDHSDAPYLESLGRRLPSGASWEIVNPDADSDHQQRVFGMADLYVACRYHPQIFAVSNAVPGLCIYYQHKALGFLQQLDLERFAFAIDDLERRTVLEALDEVLERREELSRRIAEALPALRERSARSSEIAVELFPSRART